MDAAQIAPLLTAIDALPPAKTLAMSSQHLGMTLWALAHFATVSNDNLGVCSHAKNVANRFVAQILFSVNTFQGRDIASISWALATLRIDKEVAEELFSSMAKRAVHLQQQVNEGKIGEVFTKQGIANLIWSFATIQVLPPNIGVLLNMVKADCNHVQPTVNLLWAFSTLRLLPPPGLLPLPCHSFRLQNGDVELARNAFAELESIIETAGAQHAATVSWSIGKLLNLSNDACQSTDGEISGMNSGRANGN